MTVNMRVGGPQGNFIAENFSEYIRDLIRKNKDWAEATASERLKAKLGVVFAATDNSYSASAGDEAITCNTAPRDI